MLRYDHSRSLLLVDAGQFFSFLYLSLLSSMDWMCWWLLAIRTDTFFLVPSYGYILIMQLVWFHDLINSYLSPSDRMGCISFTCYLYVHACTTVLLCLSSLWLCIFMWILLDTCLTAFCHLAGVWSASSQYRSHHNSIQSRSWIWCASTCWGCKLLDLGFLIEHPLLCSFFSCYSKSETSWQHCIINESICFSSFYPLAYYLAFWAMASLAY